MSESVDTAARALLARIDKELHREGPSTAAVGGVTKVGNDLELLLRVALSNVLSSTGRSLDEELRRTGLSRGAGTYARLLGEQRPHTSQHPLVRVLTNDLRSGRNSRVRTFIEEVRNRNNHPGPGPTSPKPSMRALAGLLRPIVGRQ